MHSPRRADAADLDALCRLEKACYDPPRRSSRDSLRRSLHSGRQEVWVFDGGDGLAAALILWWHPHVVRIYGVQVHPAMQGSGLGRTLVLWAEEQAAAKGRDRMVLEADADDAQLVEWYERQGYVRRALRDDFYAPGRSAWRMTKRLR